MPETLEPNVKAAAEACWSARHACQRALFGFQLGEGGDHAALAHVRLLIDTIEICQTAADFLTRNSAYQAEICAVTAALCDACAQSCRDLEDHRLADCIDACENCAEFCSEIASDLELEE